MRLVTLVKVTLSGAALITATFLPQHGIAKPVLRLSTDLACPWICDKGETGKPTGILPDIAHAVFSDSPWQPSPIPPKWTSGRKRLATGKIDALVAPLGDLSDGGAIGLSIAHSAIGLREQAIWAPRNKPFTWRGIDSLKKRHLAVDPTRDNGITLLFYFENLAGKGKTLTVEGKDSAGTMLTMLKNGDIDLAIHDSVRMAWQSRKLGLGNDLYEATRLDTEFLYLAFTKRNSDAVAMTEWYENGIKALRKSGQLNDILIKYGQKDWLVY